MTLGFVVGQPVETRHHHAGRHWSQQLHQPAGMALSDDQRMRLGAWCVGMLKTIARRLKAKVDEHSNSMLSASEAGGSHKSGPAAPTQFPARPGDWLAAAPQGARPDLPPR